MTKITKYDLIVFDLDGTLIDSKETIYQATIGAFKMSGDGVVIPKPKFCSMIGMHFQDIFDTLNIHVDDLEDFIQVYKSIYFDFIDYSVIYPGVTEILKYLNEIEIKCGLLTTKTQDQAEKILSYFNLSEYFVSINGRRKGIPIKPNAEPLLNICNELEIRPESTLMVGDTEIDIQCGKNAMTGTCAVEFGYRDKELLLNENPDYLINNFTQLKSIII